MKIFSVKTTSQQAMRLPLLAVVALLAPCQAERRQPNILFIMADDLGWNDVSWNNKAMTTPTLERLAREGIRLDQAYSQQVLQIDRARPTQQETKMSP